MPLGSRAALAAICVLAAEGAAAAQEAGSTRFFAEEIAAEGSEPSTIIDGSFTSTTFYYPESGEDAPPQTVGNEVAPFSASPIDRLFTDLRSQLSAKQIGGSRVEVRSDLRGRYDASSYESPSLINIQNPYKVPSQSGTFGGNEFEIRELHVTRRGSSVDVGVGRQYSLELAATRFDGLKVERPGKRWKLIAFGGLYPSRISRDIREDYPQGFVDDDPVEPGVQPGTRAFPVVGGAGTAYRYQSAYGAFGVVGILPLADDTASGTAEEPRVFGTMNGYWRARPRVDVFHYVVADATGAGGAGLTNLTLGVNLQPTDTLQAHASITRVDTETLNVIAQTKLEEPDGITGDQVPNTLQNNLEVARIAQDSARVGLSANLARRFELSTSGTLRRRGEIVLVKLNGSEDEPDGVIVLEAAQAIDVTVGAVDRQSLGGTRIGLSATRSFGVGNANLYRNQATIARLDVAKSLADDRVELEIDLAYINSQDDSRGQSCAVANVLQCYGAAEIQSVSLGGLLYWRFLPSWFAVTSLNVGTQMAKSTDAAGTLVDQPSILTATALFRLAYRF